MKPGLTALEACHRPALIEGQKENAEVKEGERVLKNKKIIGLATIVLMSMTMFSIFSSPTQAYSNHYANATILCSEQGSSMANVQASVYNLEDGVPATLVGRLQTDATGCATIGLPAGEYGVEAYLNGESGYHGYKKFNIDGNTPQNDYKIVVEMKPNQNHSASIDLTPKIAEMKPVEEDVTPAFVASAVHGKEGEEDVPIFVKNQNLRDRDSWIPVDLTKLDATTRELLMKQEEKIRSSTTYKETAPDNTVGTQSVGDKISFDLFCFGVVTSETKSDVWHPIALIDSEIGLTHTFNLDVYYGKTFTISSEIKCVGVSASASYEKTCTWGVTFGPTTCTGGEIKTYRSEFEHVYQEGDLFRWFIVWYYAGTFKREYVDDWRSLSYWVVPQQDLPETRDTYRGEWRNSIEAWATMADSSSWTGSLGVSVTRGDVFGATAQISLTYTYGMAAHHYFKYNQPGTYWYLRFYSGRAFDINTYQYVYGGGGGGCPILYVCDGSEYVEEGLLDIHATEDVVREHVLVTRPEAVNHRYLLRLTESTLPRSHSYIDQVRLYATLEDGRTVNLPLVSAFHSEYGNVLSQLLLSDDRRAETLGADLNNGVSQSINLEFLASSLGEIESFTFVIEGYNPK